MSMIQGNMFNFTLGIVYYKLILIDNIEIEIRIYQDI